MSFHSLQILWFTLHCLCNHLLALEFTLEKKFYPKKITLGNSTVLCPGEGEPGTWYTRWVYHNYQRTCLDDLKNKLITVPYLLSFLNNNLVGTISANKDTKDLKLKI